MTYLSVESAAVITVSVTSETSKLHRRSNSNKGVHGLVNHYIFGLHLMDVFT